MTFHQCLWSLKKEGAKGTKFAKKLNFIPSRFRDLVDLAVKIRRFSLEATL